MTVALEQDPNKKFTYVEQVSSDAECRKGVLNHQTFYPVTCVACHP
jgi:hypothetical protein